MNIRKKLKTRIEKRVNCVVWYVKRFAICTGYNHKKHIGGFTIERSVMDELVKMLGGV